MHPIGRSGMFIDHVVVHRSHRGDSIHQRSDSRQVFANLDILDRGIDRIVIRTSDFLLGVATSLGIERINLPHATAEPNGNHVFDVALQRRIA
jgi:hypothetical protein